jgi:hypothetical protein
LGLQVEQIAGFEGATRFAIRAQSR